MANVQGSPAISQVTTHQGPAVLSCWMGSAAAAALLQLCLTLCDSMDGSSPGSLVPGILQARTLGVGCHFLLQCMKVKSESEVVQSCLTLSDPMDCSPSGSSACGIFQARVLEWGAIALSGQGLVHVIPRALHTSLFSSPLSGSYCSSPCFTTRKLRFRVL